MSISRVFCDWKNPAIEEISNYLQSKFKAGNELDLGNQILVFSSSRAGRRLLEGLAVLAKEQQLILNPPQIITVGAFPEMLYSPNIPIATQFESLLAWTRALVKFDPLQVKIIAGTIPEPEDFLSWYNIAKNVSALYLEISANLLTFTQTAQKISSMPNSPSVTRWNLLADVFRQYQLELAEVGLIDREDARFQAIAEKRLAFSGEVILCAVRDLNESSKKMISALTAEVTALIHAPESESPGFDDFGCVVPEHWKAKEISLDLSKIITALDPADQALAALSKLETLGKHYHQSQISIGYSDQTLLPYLQGVFKEAGINLHDPGGEKLSQTRPLKLLACMGKYIAARRTKDFFELIRFPEIENYIRNAMASENTFDVQSVIAKIDEYQRDHLQAVTYSKPDLVEPREKTAVLAIESVDNLLAPFLEGKRPLDAWIGELHKFITAVYSDLNDYKDEFEAVSAAWNALADTSRTILPFVSGVEAISLFVKLFNDVAVPKEPEASDIDALGWLELQLDNAPVLIVCGMNEGMVPESVNSDSFLPESVRKYLGLLDNDRRYAREAFVLSALNNSVKSLFLVYGKIDAAGTPLLPSRLLVSCKDAELVKRTNELYLKEPVIRSLLPYSIVSSATKWESPPKPQKLKEAPTSMSVTSFKAYLECPYRFYLSHILKLDTIDDADLEMDGRLFGILAHKVLANFSATKESQSSDEEAGRQSLNQILNKCFLDQFGNRPLSAVVVQKEQLRKRLALFASWSARWRQEGWETRHVEYKAEAESSTFSVDGEPFIIDGRIDRIDFNPKTKTWAVFDYKSGEKTLEPDKAHFKNEEWTDLQLPLYYHILRKAGFEGEIQLGYIRLYPGASQDSIASFAKWDETVLGDALSAAFDVVRKVRKQVFWPPSEKIFYKDKFSSLLGTSQFFDEGLDELQ